MILCGGFGQYSSATRRCTSLQYISGNPSAVDSHPSISRNWRERIGIVGATGGGKSTLAKALHFVDISKGSIEIDGVDIATIPLGLLRSRLGIIAQDPILLSGTLRLNLDIEGVYSDTELYNTLQQVQLLRTDQTPTISTASSETSSVTAVDVSTTKDGQLDPLEVTTNIFANLDFKIEAGGDNLSAGQKQLVVLARALLKKSKILILDEATTSIDSATDTIISDVVHRGFAGATVLIIAHRLRTIMACSKVLAMDKGCIVQQGSPLELIKQEGGHFQALCRAGGPEEFQQLVALAEKTASSGLLIDL